MTSAGACRIVELRRYVLHPGMRDALIELFDREFIETQEAVGMQILGQFRDLDDPDSFVWLRGFSDMETRKRALEAFYTGPVWRAHASAANATMVDSSNVLLLRPIVSLDLDSRFRPPRGSTENQRGIVMITIYPLVGGVTDDFARSFERDLAPWLRQAGIAVRATYATEHSENTFPALPLRDDGDVFVCVATLAGDGDLIRAIAAPDSSPMWRERMSQAMARHSRGQPEVLRLHPTARSLLNAFEAAKPHA